MSGSANAFTRGRPAVARASTAPRADIPATTAVAGLNPALTPAALPRCPLAANTAATTAIANAAPNRCSMLMTPEALPMSATCTTPSAAVGVVGRAIEIPTPPRISGSTSCP